MKLQQKMFAELKEELREHESEMEVSYCEPEQGPLLGDDDEAKEERIIESLMDSVKSTDQFDLKKPLCQWRPCIHRI